MRDRSPSGSDLLGVDANPLRLVPVMLMPIVVVPVGTDLGTLPLVRGVVISQEGWAGPDDRSGEVQRAWKSVAIVGTEAPLRVKAVRAREEIAIHEARR